MDTLTHALSGALAARASWSKSDKLTLRQRSLTGFITTAFPDIDFVLRFTDDTLLNYLNYHRGVTHSILLIPFWAFLLSLIFSRLFTLTTKNTLDWKPFYLLCCLSLALHILGDVITSYGTFIFAPFSDWRAWLDTTFIIDPWFTGIIIIALIASLPRNYTRVMATGGLIVLTSYVCMQAWSHQQAIVFGQDSADKNQWHNAIINAMPQPLSPFRWKIIVEHKQHYHLTLIDLYGAASNDTNKDDSFIGQLNSAYKDPAEAQWTREERYAMNRAESKKIEALWNSNKFYKFRRFTRFPARLYENKSTGDCIWFSDLRFSLPTKGRKSFFSYGICPENKEYSELIRLPYE